MANLKLKLTNASTAEDVRVVLAILGKKQEVLANELDVTPAAVSLALANDPWLKKLRHKIIKHLNIAQGYRRAS